MGLESLELLGGCFDELQGAVSGIVLAHLGDQLGVVLEEKLDIDSLALLVTEERNKDFEHLGEGSWVVVLKDCVDLRDKILGDSIDLLAHLLLEDVGLLA